MPPLVHALNKALLGLAIVTAIYATPMTAQANLSEPTKLDRLCSKAVGEPTRYDLLEGCACPRNHVFALSADTNEPICTVRTALPSQSHCAGSEQTCYVGADAIGSDGQLQGAAISLHSKSDLAQQKAQSYSGKAFERWLPAHGFGPVTHYQFGVDFPDFFADLGELNELKRALGVGETLLGAHQGAKGSTTRALTETPRRFYAHRPEYLDAVVGIEEDFVDKGKKEALNLLRKQQWLRPLYMAYNALLEQRAELQDPKSWQFVTHKGNGCEDACRMVAIRPAVGAHRVHFWQEIIHGKIAGRYLVLTSVNSDSQMVLFLSPSFVPSMVGEVFYTNEGGEQEPAVVSENIHLYDLNGQLLADRRVPVYSRQLTELLAQHKNKALPEGGKPVVVCDGGSGADQLDWLKEQLANGLMVLGPHSSLFGWSPGKYAKAVLAGVARKDFDLLSQTRLSFSPLRATVEAAASVATALRTVPIGAYDCLANIQSWRSKLAKTGAKVALLPEPPLLTAGSVACREQALRPMDAMGDMLFVGAAGNEGRQDFAGSSCLSAKPRPNTLTIAGAIDNAGQKWNDSNYGQAGADVLVYAGAQYPTEPLYDTRYAAARTAGLAATLIADEQLTASQARLAILLGATYDEGLKPVTRSSAWLDLSWFFKAGSAEPHHSDKGEDQ